jgi:hypothetical protein
MKVMGIVATATLAVIAAFGGILFIRSIPEIRRYIKISSM